ncbi:hypothetical protein BJF78_02915 [Pseudonocardia sp. CNS-139]|nr:hypothetical protein BJF78_02915 [Pseudonocardia sp. CNS-139]
MTAARELPFLRPRGESGRAIGTRDWSATPVGAPVSWPAAIRTATGIMLESPGAVLLVWGPQLVVLHNDAAMAALGDERPDRLGRPGADAFPDTWPALRPLLDEVLAGAAVALPAGLLGPGSPPGTCTPVRGDDGAVLGVFTALAPEARPQYRTLVVRARSGSG